MGGAGPDNGTDTWSLAFEERHLIFFLVPPPAVNVICRFEWNSWLLKSPSDGINLSSAAILRPRALHQLSSFIPSTKSPLSFFSFSASFTPPPPLPR